MRRAVVFRIVRVLAAFRSAFWRIVSVVRFLAIVVSRVVVAFVATLETYTRRAHERKFGSVSQPN